MSACSISPEKQTLSDDVAILQGMVHDLSGKLESSPQTIERLKHELLLLRHWRFGRKSEKLEYNGQLCLFGDAVVEETTPPAEPEPLPAEAKRKGHGRKSIPSDLPVERVEIEPSPEELVRRPCGTEKVRIGEEVRKELDYNPGSVFVREIVRPAYACPKECEGQVVAAENAPSFKRPLLTGRSCS
ncbi:MAG: IS66 family transposase zinc-finger binding domain-containing protein [Planctomycetota bacterium]|jgi:hypothetical protein|nr:IS66 family transposase zinc-finger binding domain-containing protein [Planctomycetota bacterium]